MSSRCSSPRRRRTDSHAQTEYAEQVLVLVTRDFAVRNLLEGQHTRVEIDRAVHVAHRHGNGVDRR